MGPANCTTVLKSQHAGSNYNRYSTLLNNSAQSYTSETLYSRVLRSITGRVSRDGAMITGCRLKPNYLEWLFIIAVCNKTIVTFGFVVLFNRGRSLVIALSLPNVRWQLTKFDYSLVAPRVFCDVNGGNRIQTGFPWPRCWIRRRILYVKMNVICRQWRHRRVGRLLGGSAMMATFQGDVLLTVCFLNNLTGTGRWNYIHSTYNM